MSSNIIRKKFIENYGREKYKEFVLTLYESFPIRTRLFFWQEQLINKLSLELHLQQIDIEEVFSIFNHCPIHDVKLKEDTVCIVDGSNIQRDISIDKELELFPMANTKAFRNLELRNYPEKINVLYCPNCRGDRLMNINSEPVRKA